VHAYILMSNHFHLIVETAKATRQLKHAAPVRLSARDENWGTHQLRFRATTSSCHQLATIIRNAFSFCVGGAQVLRLVGRTKCRQKTQE
jgi:hypothetical protein